jgi:NAD(P)-dependent dehydrogenase (short-subunit alcohol dehydrogenase family)
MRPPHFCQQRSLSDYTVSRTDQLQCREGGRRRDDGNLGQGTGAAPIRVGAVAPGFIRTPMVAGMNPEALAKVTAPVSLGRLGEAAEIAQAVGFIFENEFFTGRCLELDGGLRL